MKRFTITEGNDTIMALIAKQIQGCETLDDVRESLLFETSPFCGFFIYKGGYHVAIHTSPMIGDRIAVIVEK